MANAVMGEVELDVAGTPRTLNFTFESFEEIGQALGIDDFGAVVQRLGEDLQGTVKFSTFWIVLAAALRDGWPEVDVPTLRRAFKPRDAGRISEALASALVAAMPQPEADEADAPPVPAAAGNA